MVMGRANSSGGIKEKSRLPWAMGVVVLVNGQEVQLLPSQQVKEQCHVRNTVDVAQPATEGTLEQTKSTNAMSIFVFFFFEPVWIYKVAFSSLIGSSDPQNHVLILRSVTTISHDLSVWGGTGAAFSRRFSPEADVIGREQWRAQLRQLHEA